MMGTSGSQEVEPGGSAPRRRSWVALLVVAVVTAGVVILAGYGAYTLIGQLRGGTDGDEGEVSTEVGGIAPDITVYDLAGKAVKLSEFRGEAVLLNFRATWCPYCRAEAPALQQAHESVADLAIVAIYVGEDAATVTDFAQTEGLSFPMYTDAGEAAQAYGVRGIPASYFIDAKGRIFDTLVGSLTYPAIQSYLEEQ